VFPIPAFFEVVHGAALQQRIKYCYPGGIGFMIETGHLGVSAMDYKYNSPEPSDDGNLSSSIVCGFCTTRSPEPSDDSSNPA
jgi:hypothetical protein